MRILCIVLCVISLIACQSQVEKAGDMHAKDVLVWKELAKYAGDELGYWGLTVTGSVQMLETEVGAEYKLTNIKLARKGQKIDIDLLSPEFAEKFACGLECKELNLYQPEESKALSLLSEFIDKEEGNFFRFYGQLTNLNKKIRLYRKASPQYMMKYLTWVRVNNKGTESLQDFVNLLEEYFTEDKLASFIRGEFDVDDNSKLMLLSDGEVNDLPTEEVQVMPDGMDNLPTEDVELWSNVKEE